MGGRLRVEDEGHAREAGCDLLEHLQPLSCHAGLVTGKAGHVAARPRQAGNEALADWVRDHHEHDRYGVGDWLQDGQRRRALRHEHVRRQADQFPCQRQRQLGVVSEEAIVDPNVAALRPSQSIEGLLERSDAALHIRIARAPVYERADPADSVGGLGDYGARPPDRSGGEKCYEIAPPHSITSSAPGIPWSPRTTQKLRTSGSFGRECAA